MLLECPAGIRHFLEEQLQDWIVEVGPAGATREALREQARALLSQMEAAGHR